MTWAARNPHPGESPAKPADEEPTSAREFEAWWQARERWNSYVMAVRRHDLARFVDSIVAREENGFSIEHVEIAMRTVATMILDGTIPSNFAVPHAIWKL